MITNAIEARTKSEREPSILLNMTQVLSLIDNAASLGDTSIILDNNHIISDQLLALVDLGFKVSNYTEYNKRIAW